MEIRMEEGRANKNESLQNLFDEVCKENEQKGELIIPSQIGGFHFLF